MAFNEQMDLRAFRTVW